MYLDSAKLHVHLCIFMCVYIHRQIYAHTVHASIRWFTHTYIHTHTYYTGADTSSPRSTAPMHAYIPTHIHLNAFSHTYIHTYTHTYYTGADTSSPRSTAPMTYLDRAKLYVHLCISVYLCVYICLRKKKLCIIVCLDYSLVVLSFA